MPEQLISCQVAMEMDDGERMISMGSRKKDCKTPVRDNELKTSSYSTTLTVTPSAKGELTGLMQKA